MKRRRKLFTKRLLACFLLLACVLFAQAPTTTQQSATTLDSATRVDTAVTATTITITPPAGQFVYISEIDIQNCAGASAVTAAAVTTVTTTNITGSPAWTVGSGVAAGLCTNQVITYPKGLKSTTAGTATTFVLPTFATNQTIRVNVASYSGL